MNKSQYKYDIAVSFAGEDRSIVEEFVTKLSRKNISVFYDAWEQAKLWGKDLYQYLDLIYRQAAHYCVIFVSESYVKKAWTKHELRSAQGRAFEQNDEYILPIKLDESVLPGIPETIAYIDIRNTNISKIVDLVIEKLDKPSQPDKDKIVHNAKSNKKDVRLDALSKIAIYQLTDLLDLSSNIMLHDPDPEVRERAAWVIDNLNDESALDALMQAIHDDFFGVRSAAGWGLVHLGAVVIPHMDKIMKSSDNPGARAMANLVLMHL